MVLGGDNVNTYWASYNWTGRYQSYDERELIVIAETASVALGLALEAEPDTSGDFWKITEIDNKTQSATRVASRSS